MRLDDERLKRALSGPVVPIDGASMDRDLHVVVQRGRRRRRKRHLVGVVAMLVAVVGAVVLAPRALDALRSVGEPRPATPPEPRGAITTVAGTGVARSSGGGGPAVEAAIRYPYDLVVDSAGDLYILESGRVRRVDGSGRITTVVGPPTTDEATALTEAHQLRLGRTVNALAIDAEDNLYVGGGEGKHFMVNRISPTGDVTRVAGTGRAGYSGDGGPSTEAELGWVNDIVVDPSGNIFITDWDNHRVRMIDTAGVITTVAGTGERGYSGDGGSATAARFNEPNGIAVDAQGNVYVADSANHAIRRIDRNTGVITTLAGTGRGGYSGDDGPATQARLNAPHHVEIDDDGKLYIEDTGNHCIRMVDSEGIIQTIVGTCEPGFSGDGGPARSARLWQPSGMLLTSGGVLYIADSGNNRVRRVIL
jgi:sugar lactone lactonase YvrE